MLHLEKCPLFLYMFRTYYFLLPSVFHTINRLGTMLNRVAKDCGLKHSVIFSPIACPIRKDTPFKEVCCLLNQRDGCLYYIFNYNAVATCLLACYCMMTQDLSLRLLRSCLILWYPLYKTLESFAPGTELGTSHHHSTPPFDRATTTLWLSYWFFITIYESVPWFTMYLFVWSDVVEICFLYILVRYNILKRWIRESLCYIQNEIIIKQNYHNLIEVFHLLSERLITNARLHIARSAAHL